MNNINNKEAPVKILSNLISMGKIGVFILASEIEWISLKLCLQVESHLKY